MLEKKKWSFFIVIGIFLLTATPAYALINTIGGLYYDYYGWIDFLLFFSLFLATLIPFTKRIFNEEKKESASSSTVIASLAIALISSISLVTWESTYGFSLIDIWYVPLALIGAMILSHITHAFKKEGTGENKNKWYIIPLVLIIILSLIVFLTPNLSYYFPFYYFGDLELWAIGGLIGLLILIVGYLITKKFKDSDNTGGGDTRSPRQEPQTPEQPQIQRQEKIKKLKSVTILPQKGGTSLLPHQQAKLIAIVPGFYADDPNLEFIWASDVPLESSGNTALVHGNAVTPREGSETRKVHVTVRHKITQQQKSNTIRITFIKEKVVEPEREKIPQVISTKIEVVSPKRDAKIIQDSYVLFKCKLVAYDPSAYKKENFQYYWFITPNHVPINLNNISSLEEVSTQFGRQGISFTDKIPNVPTVPGNYTILVVAQNSVDHRPVAVASQYIKVIEKETIEKPEAGPIKIIYPGRDDATKPETPLVINQGEEVEFKAE